MATYQIHTTLRISHDLHKALHKAKERLNIPVSEIIRKAIKDWLKKH